MSRAACFVWGMVGAILPEVLRFFTLVSAGKPLPNINWILYLSIGLAYMLCAGLSVAWKPENEFKGLWVGASLPAIIATLVQAPPALPK